MLITYTNRKGVAYYLGKKTTKAGRSRYFFYRQPKGEPVEEIPKGYEINENVNGIVSLAKKRPLLILPEEVDAVKRVLIWHPKARNYRLHTRTKYIEIYEMNSPDLAALEERFTIDGRLSPEGEQVLARLERSGWYYPTMRFVLSDEDQRTFYAELLGYREDDTEEWIPLIPEVSIELLAELMIPRLDGEGFFAVRC